MGIVKRLKRIFAQLLLFIFENKQSLQYIVEHHKQNHAHSHRYILTQANIAGRKQLVGRPFGHPISHQVAEKNGHNKATNLSPAFARRAESEVLVQEVAQDASKHIICSRRHPIATAQKIVSQKHDSCSEQCIDNSDQGKANGRVLCDFLFHT